MKWLLAGVVALAAAREAFDYDQCRADAGEDAYVASGLDSDALLDPGSAHAGGRAALAAPAGRRVEVAALSSSVGAASPWPCLGRPADAAYAPYPNEDCACGWPGRLAFALEKAAADATLARGAAHAALEKSAANASFHVRNYARHGEGPNHFLSRFDGGAAWRGGDVVVLEFAAYLSLLAAPYTCFAAGCC